jgi:glycosyltransferase involved in cell wall biosynthesis
MNREPIDLTAILISKNASRTISATLTSLSFCSELIVIDSGSDDGTVAIARSHGARVIETDWPGFGIQKQRAVQAVTTPWALSIDCDEVVSDSLRLEIISVLDNPSYEVYRMPRLNHLCGRPVRCAGWYPDYVERLFRVESAHFSEASVHESLDYVCVCGTLKSPLFHYTYDTIEVAVEKLNCYSSLGASRLSRRLTLRNRRVRRWMPPLRFLYRFFYSFIVRRGCLGGLDGFTVSLLQAVEVYFKYLKALN